MLQIFILTLRLLLSKMKKFVIQSIEIYLKNIIQ